MTGGDERTGGRTTISPRRIADTANIELQLWTLFSPDDDVEGQVWPMRRRSLLLGREVGEGHLCIAGDRALSRIHASIAIDEAEDCLALVDLESANGSFVNGRRVQRSELSVGDVLRVGDTVLHLVEGQPGRLRWRSIRWRWVTVASQVRRDAGPRGSKRPTLRSSFSHTSW
jgi:hypothetical protein